MRILINFAFIGLCGLATTSFASQHHDQAMKIDHFGTGNDGDNTTGLLLVDHEKVYSASNTYVASPEPMRIEHYGTGNDGDNTTGLLLKE
ncbi:MAG: hypothetical protein GAK29_00463 [Acinetobacter bereziniae]|uniref:Uncharacterized protein n=1 Tax=Acinetobacter bereziniae TaxID=106648 RepID=A0A833PHU2_ACIBZ|nr:MAG: hypothetical protein GAK29_00463 [Acinetobacter bereziniae]